MQGALADLQAADVHLLALAEDLLCKVVLALCAVVDAAVTTSLQAATAHVEGHCEEPAPGDACQQKSQSRWEESLEVDAGHESECQVPASDSARGGGCKLRGSGPGPESIAQ